MPFPLPAYLSGDHPAHTLSVELTVAFRDCDPMGVLWHGNFLAYCEQAREALGVAIGFGVARIAACGWFAPVVRSQVVHRAPARPADRLTVEVALYPSAQPRLYHRFRLRRGDLLIADAETEQVLTDRAFTLILSQPAELATVFAGG